MRKDEAGSTLLENIIAISALGLYTVTIVVLISNLMYQQETAAGFIKMNTALQNSAEEFLNKKYADIAVGTANDEVDGFKRTTAVTENVSRDLKEIEIIISDSKGGMKVIVEKGLDIN